MQHITITGSLLASLAMIHAAFGTPVHSLSGILLLPTTSNNLPVAWLETSGQWKPIGADGPTSRGRSPPETVELWSERARQALDNHLDSALVTPHNIAVWNRDSPSGGQLELGLGLELGPGIAVGPGIEEGLPDCEDCLWKSSGAKSRIVSSFT